MLPHIEAALEVALQTQQDHIEGLRKELEGSRGRVRDLDNMCRAQTMEIHRCTAQLTEQMKTIAAYQAKVNKKKAPAPAAKKAVKK